MLGCHNNQKKKKFSRGYLPKFKYLIEFNEIYPNDNVDWSFKWISHEKKKAWQTFLRNWKNKCTSWIPAATGPTDLLVFYNLLMAAPTGPTTEMNDGPQSASWAWPNYQPDSFAMRGIMVNAQRFPSSRDPAYKVSPLELRAPSCSGPKAEPASDTILRPARFEKKSWGFPPSCRLSPF